MWRQTPTIPWWSPVSSLFWMKPTKLLCFFFPNVHPCTTINLPNWRMEAGSLWGRPTLQYIKYWSRKGVCEKPISFIWYSTECKRKHHLRREEKRFFWHYMHVKEAARYATIPGQAHRISFFHGTRRDIWHRTNTALKKPILEKQIWRCNEKTVYPYKYNYLHNEWFTLTPLDIYLRDFEPDINQWQRDTSPET